MRDAVIVEAVRTPVGRGKPGGALSGIHPVDLLAHSLARLVERTDIDPALIDDVIGGCVGQIGEQAANTTRYAVLAAGLPETVPATTVDRQCGSAQQAVHFAAQGVIAGAYDIAVACGVESMSRVPMGSQVPPGKDPRGAGVHERYPDGLVGQGISAELIASKWNLSRTALDEYSLRSHQRAAAAHDAGRFGAELAPIKAPTVSGEVVEVDRDETVRRDTSLERLASLAPAFRNEAMAARFPELDWRITAGNSSPTNDGSAALLIMTSEMAAKLGLRPLARLHSFAVTGDDPFL